MIRIRFLKIIDALFGPLAVLALSWAGPPRINKIERFGSLLILRPGGIGDAVLMVPAINELKKRFPFVFIDVLAENRNSSIFSLCPSVHAVLRYDRPGDLLSAIRGSYDIVIDSEQWHRLSAAVAKLNGAPVVIGYATNERKKAFTNPISYSHDDYEMQSFFNLISPVSGPIVSDPKVPFLSISPALNEKAKLILKPVSKKRIIALFPGGSIYERRWGSDRFHQTAAFLNARGCSIIAVGGREDVKAGNAIIRGLPYSLNLAGKLSLPETAAVLKESFLLITGDSGVMHIGYGVGTKIVALFGPGREKKWAPRGQNCRVINKNLACSPCTAFGYTPHCNKNAVCMSSISVEDVFDAAMSLLNSGEKQA